MQSSDLRPSTLPSEVQVSLRTATSASDFLFGPALRTNIEGQPFCLSLPRGFGRSSHGHRMLSAFWGFVVFWVCPMRYASQVSQDLLALGALSRVHASGALRTCVKRWSLHLRELCR